MQLKIKKIKKMGTDFFLICPRRKFMLQIFSIYFFAKRVQSVPTLSVYIPLVNAETSIRAF